MRAARMQPARALRGARGSSDPATQRLRALLTVAEIALAVMLLVAGGVALRSFSALVGVDPGVRIAEVATARVTPSVSRYREDPQVIGFYERAIATLSAMPDVAHAGAVSLLPLSGMTSDWGFGVEGYVAPTPALEPDEQARVVGGHYFQALGIPLRAGRFFEARDTAGAPPVAIVSELVAKKYWREATPIGRRIRRWGLDSREPWTTVIGIVGDIRNHGPGSDPVPMIYFPVTQIAEPTMTLVARMQPGSTRGLAAIAEAVRRVDPQQPLFATRTMEDWMSRTVAAPRFNLVLLTLFATFAIALAAVGVYGVMAFTVTRRTRELGIRLALGARPASLMQLVLRHSLTLAGAGVAAGLSAGLVAATAIESQFYGARVFDPLVIVLVPAIVLGVALLASYLPARRAMHVDPVVALRAE
jgi:putative ABC transport system permease protein